MGAPVRVVNQAIDSLIRARVLVDLGSQFADDMACNLASQLQNEDDAGVNSLKEVMLSFCKVQKDTEQFAHAAKAVVMEAQRSQDFTDLESVLNERLSELQRQDKDTDCRSHARFLQMEEHIRSRIETVADDADLSRNAKQLVQLDEDMAVVETEINTKCPVTQQEMKNPVTNRHCNHNYDLNGAKELIRNRPQARCPVAGCKNSNPLRLEDLEDNKQLKRYIDKKHRKASKV